MIHTHRFLWALVLCGLPASLIGAIHEYSFTGTIERASPELETFFKDDPNVSGTLRLDMTSTQTTEPLEDAALREAIASLQLSLGRLRISAGGGAVSSGSGSGTARESAFDVSVSFSPQIASIATGQSPTAAFAALESVPSSLGIEWSITSLDLSYDATALQALETMTANGGIILRGHLVLADANTPEGAEDAPSVDFVVTRRKRKDTADEQASSIALNSGFWGVSGALDIPELFDPEFDGELSSVPIGGVGDEGIDTIGLIPEPTAFSFLTALGILGMVARRRR